VIESPRLWPLIEARAEATPERRMAVDAQSREISFGAYRDRALALARSLATRGLGPGVRVSWIGPSRIETTILIGALARLGVVQNPILPIYRARELRFIVDECRPAALVTPGHWRGFDYRAMANEAARAQPGLQTLVLDEILAESSDAEPPPAPTTSASPADEPVRWIFHTSGTTSQPKGVQHTDASLWTAARGMSRALALDENDRVAFVFPITHIGGLNWLQAGLATGCTLILIEHFADPSTLPTLRREGVTLATAGTVFHEAYLAAHRACEDPPLFPHVRAFPGGGAPKPPRLHEDLVREMGGVGIVSGYGLTEAPIVTMGRIDDPDAKLAGTEGRVADPGVALRIVRADETPAAAGETGEIRVRGPQLFRGYVDSRLDAQAFDAAGYFRTGDLGHLDAQGHLVVTGRSKDVIIRMGENIPAKEVEDLLATHPEVADVAVIGLPDARTGERCCAIVVCRDPADPPSLDDLRRFLREQQLMTQKIPEQLELVDAIPRNPTGKILKPELRVRFST
jgi:acyl-CoA synthetase (AMP-forming)/AMP-acid ligase II